MDIDALVKKVLLSEDMTKATDLTSAEVAELLDDKLLLNEIAPGDFKDTLNEIQAELECETNALLANYGLGSKELGKLAEEIKQDSVQSRHFKNLMTASKLLLRIRDEHDVDEADDEAFVDACNLILYMSRIRIQRDAVPLITRGLYASQVMEARRFWNKHRAAESGKTEGLWQKELAARHVILSRVLGGHVVLMGQQQHTGTPSLDGSGDRITDYLFKHAVTRNVTFVEIKTPFTPLLGKSYRNTYPLSQDLSGSVSQVLLQRSELSKAFYYKKDKSNESFDVAAATCVVVAGSTETEIGSDEQKARAFEMQRNALSSHVRIITFDELYAQFALFHNVDIQA